MGGREEGREERMGMEERRKEGKIEDREGRRKEKIYTYIHLYCRIVRTYVYILYIGLNIYTRWVILYIGLNIYTRWVCVCMFTCTHLHIFTSQIYFI